jgi:3-deoxy-D-manno-octulosonate 8-phosphate phosphatase (KDO 8-P phosphatase)
MAEPSLAERCRRIRLLLFDVDGVLTPGDIIHAADGNELKRFHVRDGSALTLWHQAGKQSGVITGRRSPVVDVRANEVGITQVIQGASPKVNAFEHLLKTLAVAKEEACYVGDDLPDIPVLEQVGLAVAVADACPEARALAHYLTRAPGGGGALREVIERILRCQGLWPEAIG